MSLPSPMSHTDRLLLAVSPKREVERLSAAELCEVLEDLAACEWSNELRERVGGLVVSEAVNRWMAATRGVGEGTEAVGHKGTKGGSR